MTQWAELRVFATRPHPCSYLPDQRATTLFVDPAAPMDTTLYSELSSAGFRRSGPHVYRPHCAHCQACVSVRIPVDEFRPSRSQRRLLRRNQDLEVTPIDDLEDPQYYQLYERYIDARHYDGDMYPPSQDQFHAFLTREWDATRFYAFRDPQRLLAVAVVDQLNDGLSAIYTFYDPDPDIAARSLGTFAVLWQIHLARQLGLHAVYLGYWIRECRKMSYKLNFQPIELLLNDHWVRMA